MNYITHGAVKTNRDPFHPFQLRSKCPIYGTCFQSNSGDRISLPASASAAYNELRNSLGISSHEIDQHEGRHFITYWDIHPDGKRFLMMKEVAAEVPRKINIVVNWFEELKQRVLVNK